MGGRGTAAVRGMVSQKADTYTRGKDTYSVSYNENDKRYYLNVERPLSNGETLREKYRIAYAKDDDKAEIYIKELRTVIKMSEDKNILKLLQNKRSQVSRGITTQQATNARAIDSMNEAQLDKEIARQETIISRAEKTMQKNDITSTAGAKAMQEAFPLGVGGDGWSAERRRAQQRGIERDTKRATEYTQAYNTKRNAEARLKNLTDAKKEVQGTGKTQSQIKTEKVKQIVANTQSTLKWKTVQKGGYTSNGGYQPKVIRAGDFEIHGSEGLYTIYKNGNRVGSTDKLSKAKAYVERKK